MGDSLSTKRTPLRRTHHASAEVSAWETFMLLGTDWFHALARAGLSPDEIERQAPLVWRKHAARFMAIWRTDYGSGLPYGAKQWGLDAD